MSVYVDTLFYSSTAPIKGYWCHMASDNDNLEELHLLAKKLGLHRSYFQLKDNGTFPHYDLFESKSQEGTEKRKGKRSQAVNLGAIEVSGSELARKCWLDEKLKPKIRH